MLRSLEAVSGLESNSRVFTVQVQGLLHLQVSNRWVGFSDLGGSYSLVQILAPDRPLNPWPRRVLPSQDAFRFVWLVLQLLGEYWLQMLSLWVG